MTGQVTSTRIWHVNADEPRFLDWGDVTYVAPGPYRSSDHDPVLIGINLKRSGGGTGGSGSSTAGSAVTIG